MRSVICSSTQAVGRKCSWMREYGRCLSDGLLKEKMCQGNVATPRSESLNFLLIKQKSVEWLRDLGNLEMNVTDVRTIKSLVLLPRQ